MTAADPRAIYIAGMRKLMDLLEAHPELELPFAGRTGTLAFYFWDDATAPGLIAAQRAALGGEWTDPDGGDYIHTDSVFAGLNVELTRRRVEGEYHADGACAGPAGGCSGCRPEAAAS